MPYYLRVLTVSCNGRSFNYNLLIPEYAGSSFNLRSRRWVYR